VKREVGRRAGTHEQSKGKGRDSRGDTVKNKKTKEKKHREIVNKKLARGWNVGEEKETINKEKGLLGIVK